MCAVASSNRVRGFHWMEGVQENPCSPESELEVFVSMNSYLALLLQGFLPVSEKV